MSEPIVRNEVALESIKTLTEAMEHCWKGSGIPAKVLADRFGIDYSAWVRMFSAHDPRNFPPDFLPRLMQECQSTLPLEWLALQMGYRIHAQSLEEVLLAIRDALVKEGQNPRFMFGLRPSEEAEG